MNRKIILSTIAALGALGIASTSGGRESSEPQVDPAAVDRYIARLAAQDGPQSRAPEVSDKLKHSKEQANKVGRMEPMIGAALTALK